MLFRPVSNAAMKDLTRYVLSPKGVKNVSDEPPSVMAERR